MQLLLYLILISTIILFKLKSLNAFQWFLLPDISNTLKYNNFYNLQHFYKFSTIYPWLKSPHLYMQGYFLRHKNTHAGMHAFTAGRNSEVFVSTCVLFFRFVHRIQKRNRDALAWDLKRSNEVTGVSKESFLHPRSHLKK